MKKKKIKKRKPSALWRGKGCQAFFKKVFEEFY